jgi:hypothetical protein
MFGLRRRDSVSPKGFGFTPFYGVVIKNGELTPAGRRFFQEHGF